MNGLNHNALTCSAVPIPPWERPEKCGQIIISFKWPVNIKVMPGCFAKAPVISGHKLISKP